MPTTCFTCCSKGEDVVSITVLRGSSRRSLQLSELLFLQGHDAWSWIGTVGVTEASACLRHRQVYWNKLAIPAYDVLYRIPAPRFVTPCRAGILLAPSLNSLSPQLRILSHTFNKDNRGACLQVSIVLPVTPGMCHMWVHFVLVLQVNMQPTFAAMAAARSYSSSRAKGQSNMTDRPQANWVEA
jgi:hypothetical protein